MDSIAPTVRSGQSDQAIFAEVNISMTAVPMSDGICCPPNSVLQVRPFQPPSTKA